MFNRRRWRACMITGFFLLFFLTTAAAAMGDDSKAAGETGTNASDEMVSIDFNDVDIKLFIKFISELTGKNFLVDRRVKGNVSIISPSRISRKEAFQVFESVLNIHGFTTVEAGRVIKIIPSPEARSQNVDTRISISPEKPRDRIVTRIIPLQFADADELKRLFAPLVSKGSVVLSYRDTNMLIITDTLSNIDRLMKVIQAVDVVGMGKKISVISVEHADALKLVKSLSTIFRARSTVKKGKKDPNLMVQFVADERTNSVVVLASELEIQRIKSLIKLLDTKAPKGKEKIRVYYLEHASAENLAKVLQEIPTQKGKQTKGKQLAPIVSGNVRITADTATNSLIITADKEDYPILEDVISKLDIPRSMVYIECLLMEVNTNDGLNLGTEWRAGEGIDTDSEGNDRGVIFGGSGGSGYSNFNTIATTGNLPAGFTAGVMGRQITIGGLVFPSIGAVVQAYKTDKDVHILSRPQILTMDNEEAVLTIGKNVPYQTRSAAENATDTYSSYEYKDVGITLKITPQISKDRLVRLKVFQESTSLDSVNQTSGGNDRPTTLKRQLETTLIVEDGNTVVMGGLIDESLSDTTYSVPCLGDIPGLGYLFKSISKGRDRTNLYVFLTPRVIKNPLEAEKIYKVKQQEMDTITNGEVKLYREGEKAK